MPLAPAALSSWDATVRPIRPANSGRVRYAWRNGGTVTSWNVLARWGGRSQLESLPVLLERDEAAFLLSCLRLLAQDAPCQARIEHVAESIAGRDDWSASALPDTIYARSLALAAVLWSVDAGLIATHQDEIAERVLRHVWDAGPIRPQLVAAQLQCLVGQEPGERHCSWTCPTMIRANAGYGSALALGGHDTFPGIDPRPALLRSVVTEPRIGGRGSVPGAIPGDPATTRATVHCRACGRPGILEAIDPEDGWTVVVHDPDPRSPEGMPAQCRFMAATLEPDRVPGGPQVAEGTRSPGA